MDEITAVAHQNLETAYRIIDELAVKKIWESLDAACHLVGSVKTGLLMNHLDIDFHTYSETMSIEKSFRAIAMISKHPKITELFYRNLLGNEDRCLEWHLTYEENAGRTWTIDIIHMENESPYAGMVERVTDRINAVLTEQKRKTILTIKWQCRQCAEKIPGMEIYQAVLDDGIATFEEFISWRTGRSSSGISLWEPKI